MLRTVLTLLYINELLQESFDCLFYIDELQQESLDWLRIYR